MTTTPGSAALLADATCYVERSKVREILIGQPDENLHITELLLSEIDALPIVTAGDFRLAAKPDEDGVREATAKTCLDDTGLKITKELYKAVSGHTGDACLLAMIGSWGDTLDDPDILAGLHRYNEMGECFIPALSTTGHPKT